MKWVFAFLLGVFLTIGVFVYSKLGLYKDVVISNAARGPYYLVYKVHRGAYHKIGSVLEEVEAWVKEQGLLCAVSFGYYLDNPQQVDQDRLRSLGGCLYEQKPFLSGKKLGWVGISEMKKAVEGRRAFSEKVHFLKWPQKKYIIAQFGGAPSIAVFKVYPKVYQAAQERRWGLRSGVLEIYTRHSADSLSTDFLFERL